MSSSLHGDSTLHGRRIIVGVSGGIAAYKSADLVSKLVQSGIEVQVVMTTAATHFVGPATFQALTAKPVVTELLSDPAYPLGAHVELAADAELMCVAPATADYLSKVAHGQADDLLTTLTLAFTGPLLVAPAMNSDMWSKPAVARNVAILKEDGVHLVGPGTGWLSCRRSGAGRMAEPAEIIDAIHQGLASESQ